MNIQRLQSELRAILKSWTKDSKSVDAIGISMEWINGVCYGIRLAIKAVNDHVYNTRQRRKRGTS